MGVQRQRLPSSCTQCRRRKIRCDGRVPECASCVHRGITHLCRWGDERDKALQPGQGPKRSVRPIHAPGELLAQLAESDSSGWRAAMKQYTRHLPPKDKLDKIVEFHLQELEPIMCIFNRAVLQSELQELYMHLGEQSSSSAGLGIPGSRGLASYDDTYWHDARHYGLLSVVLAIVYSVGSAVPPSEAHTVLPCSGLAQRKAVFDAVHEAALALLDESNYMLKPTLWTLQSIVLLQKKYMFDMQPQVVAAWNSVAIRLAQGMGLDRLGSAFQDLARHKSGTAASKSAVASAISESLPPAEPKDFAERELGRSLWHMLLSVDWTVGVHAGIPYSVHESQSHTAPPTSLSDEEVFRMAQYPVQELLDLESWIKKHEQDPYVAIRTSTARCVREIITLRFHARDSGDSASVDDRIREIDAQFCTLLEGLPQEFHLDEQVLHKARPHLPLQRLFVQHHLSVRLLLLHRPCLSAPADSPLYMRAAEASLDAARTVLVVYQELCRSRNPNLRFWFVPAQLISAVSVLYTLATKRSSRPHASLNTDPEIVYQLKQASSLLDHEELGPMFDHYPMFAELFSKVRRFCEESRPSDGLAEDLFSMPIAPGWDQLNMEGLNGWLLDSFADQPGSG